jgi:hypothetical protein
MWEAKHDDDDDDDDDDDVSADSHDEDDKRQNVILGFCQLGSPLYPYINMLCDLRLLPNLEASRLMVV